MRIALGSDHAGYQRRKVPGAHLVEGGRRLDDVGTDYEIPFDDPASWAAAPEVRGTADLRHDETIARFARTHDDAAVLSMEGRSVAPEPEECA